MQENSSATQLRTKTLSEVRSRHVFRLIEETTPATTSDVLIPSPFGAFDDIYCWKVSQEISTSPKGVQYTRQQATNVALFLEDTSTDITAVTGQIMYVARATCSNSLNAYDIGLLAETNLIDAILTRVYQFAVTLNPSVDPSAAPAPPLPRTPRAEDDFLRLMLATLHALAGLTLGTVRPQHCELCVAFCAQLALQYGNLAIIDQVCTILSNVIVAYSNCTMSVVSTHHIVDHLIAFFSAPSPAAPSPDRKNMRNSAFEGFIHLIYNISAHAHTKAFEVPLDKLQMMVHFILEHMNDSIDDSLRRRMIFSLVHFSRVLGVARWVVGTYPDLSVVSGLVRRHRQHLALIARWCCNMCFNTDAVVCDAMMRTGLYHELLAAVAEDVADPRLALTKKLNTANFAITWIGNICTLPEFIEPALSSFATLQLFADVAPVADGRVLDNLAWASAVIVERGSVDVRAELARQTPLLEVLAACVHRTVSDVGIRYAVSTASSLFEAVMTLYGGGSVFGSVVDIFSTADGVKNLRDILQHYQLVYPNADNETLITKLLNDIGAPAEVLSDVLDYADYAYDNNYAY